MSLKLNDRIGVLIVDDDVDVLNLVEHELKSDFDVSKADSIIQAFEQVKNNDIKIVLSDERLGNESGAELLADIKEQYPDIVRILISGYTDSDAIMNAINKANVFKFIVKPWGKQLKAIVEEAHQHYLSQKKNEYKDTLTSLKSENTILDHLNSELKRSSRYDCNLSTVLLDISNPKKDSELHDFLVDRFLLKKIADILVMELRESDIAGRLRDNKFLVLLTETDEKGAGVFVNRLMKQIDEFEEKVNRGILPYKIETASQTVLSKQSIEMQNLLDKLYNKLDDPV